MKDSQILSSFFKEFLHSRISVVTVLLAAIAGAALGVTAYFNGWLG